MSMKIAMLNTHSSWNYKLFYDLHNPLPFWVIIITKWPLHLFIFKCSFHDNFHKYGNFSMILFSLVSAFSQKNKTYKMGLCVCLCTVLVPHNNFHTSYAIDMKFWLHIVSYQNSPTPLIPFLNFENCPREKFLNFIFSPFEIAFLTQNIMLHVV